MILRRIEGSRFSEVLPAWSGQAVVIIGGGESLTLEQIAVVKAAHDAGACRCIAINDVYLWAPWADVQYAADPHWLGWHTAGIDKPLLGLSAADVRAAWAVFPGQKCSIESGESRKIADDVHLLRNRDGCGNHGVGLSTDPRAIVTGRNSGFQALNVAALASCSTILLLAFDNKERARSHWHGDHPMLTPTYAYTEHRKAMSAAEDALIRAGIEVVNVTPGSAIDSFRKSTLEMELTPAYA